MRRRTIANLPGDVAPRELKLGSGGLRDVEFAVQLLQLVHGRGDESLRVGGDPAGARRAARRRLRRRRRRGQPGRRLPVPARRPNTACSCAGCGAPTSCPQDAGELARRWPAAWASGPTRAAARPTVFEAEWALHAREVRRLHEKLFYRPLLEAVARVPSEALRLTPVEAGRRLAALGFADPPAALRHIEALTAGLSRRAALQRALLPVLLSYFADAPEPDAGLLAYRQVSDALGETPWYLRLLRDEGEVASRLAYVLATSRYVAAMLPRAPDALQMLAGDDQLVPRPAAELHAAMVDAVQPPARRRPGRPGRARAAPPRAAAHRLRRPARPARRDRGLRGDQRDHRSDPRRRAAGRDRRGRRRDAGVADACRCASRSSRWAGSAAWRPATAPTPT